MAGYRKLTGTVFALSLISVLLYMKLIDDSTFQIAFSVTMGGFFAGNAYETKLTKETAK